MSSSTSVSDAPKRMRLLPSSVSTLDMQRCESMLLSKAACKKDVRVLACANVVNDAGSVIMIALALLVSTVLRITHTQHVHLLPIPVYTSINHPSYPPRTQSAHSTIAVLFDMSTTCFRGLIADQPSRPFRA